MALGNIIGSGIFLGSGAVISIAGPAAVTAYIFGGVIMIMEVMFITEMTIINPAPVLSEYMHQKYSVLG